MYVLNKLWDPIVGSLSLNHYIMALQHSGAVQPVTVSTVHRISGDPVSSFLCSRKQAINLASQPQRSCSHRSAALGWSCGYLPHSRSLSPNNFCRKLAAGCSLRRNIMTPSL